MKNIVCIDLDDTICDTYTEIMKYAIEFDINHLGNSGKVNKEKESSDYYYFARSLNWSRDDVILFFKTFYPKYLTEVVPKKNVSNILKKIKNKKYKIYIVSSRKETADGTVQFITEKWLKDNNIFYDRLIINCDDKPSFVKKNSAKFFIDDSYDNCINVKNLCPNCNVYLINTVYNKKIECKDIKRINDLSEVLDGVM